jgi:AcrR family transcriptional regulator
VIGSGTPNDGQLVGASLSMSTRASETPWLVSHLPFGRRCLAYRPTSLYGVLVPRTYPSSKSKILDATERVILRDGSKGLSLDAVLREAGVSKGGFFHHFATKDALLAALTERLSGAVAAQIEDLMARDEERHGRSLRAQIALAFDMPKAETERIRALVLTVLSAVMEAPAVAASTRAGNELALKLAAADGVDPGVALVVQFALDGYFLAESMGTTKLGPTRKAALREALVSLVEPKRKARRHAP